MGGGGSGGSGSDLLIDETKTLRKIKQTYQFKTGGVGGGVSSPPLRKARNRQNEPFYKAWKLADMLETWSRSPTTYLQNMAFVA